MSNIDLKKNYQGLCINCPHTGMCDLQNVVHDYLFDAPIVECSGRVDCWKEAADDAYTGYTTPGRAV